MFVKGTLSLIIRLTVILASICLSYEQMQMEFPGQGAMSPTMDFSSVIVGNMPEDSNQNTQVGSIVLDQMPDQFQVPTPVQNTMVSTATTTSTTTKNEDDLDNSFGSQVSAIQPASSVIGYISPSRSHNGYDNYFSTIPQERVPFLGFFPPTENQVAFTLPGQIPAASPLTAAPPGTNGFVPPATGATMPPVSSGFVPPGMGGFVPPATGATMPPVSSGFVPPTTGGFVPPTTGGFVPPATGGFAPPVTGGQPGTSITPGGLPVSFPMPGFSQQLLQSSLWPYIILPESILQYLLPRNIISKPYGGIYSPRWLRILQEMYRNNLDALNQPVRDYGDIYPSGYDEYYLPADTDLQYLPKKKKRIDIFRRKRRSSPSKPLS
ncbi:unnamed protein product [Trichobilharzia regenti]|uniref:Secreted protein n=1 Tax=Trichobilharzia regenti TaxID=157069 RepID=A0A183VVI5_TRIRE|nr:unnamed protein product [Trichobilharzia regenti]VDQ00370.1 unnamed protein product [Trichobilharzia regenti]